MPYPKNKHADKIMGKGRFAPNLEIWITIKVEIKLKKRTLDYLCLPCTCQGRSCMSCVGKERKEEERKTEIKKESQIDR